MADQETAVKRDMRPLVEKATSVVRKLRESGWETYFAGGCVRDMILGIEPKDFDIATAAIPEEVVQTFPNTIAIGAQFGVIQVRYGGEGFEVATFREDGGYTDGRRPDSVTFSSAIEDVKRRDFTINGLLFDPLTDTLHDFVNGESDLKQGIIRAIGEPRQRIEEDYLRMLRAVRFAARFDFIIDPETLRAVQINAEKIKDVSRERIREELFKMFGDIRSRKGLELLERAGLLAQLFPKSWVFTEDSLAAALDICDAIPSNDPIPLFLLLLHNATNEELESFAREMTFSNAERKVLLEMSGGLKSIEELHDGDQPDMKRLVRREWWKRLEPLAIQLQGRQLMGGFSASKLMEIRHQWTQEDLWPSPFLDGGDLKALGLKPGPQFKDILLGPETRQLDGTISSKEQAIEWVMTQS